MVEVRRLEAGEAAAGYDVATTALLAPSLTPAQVVSRLQFWEQGRSWGVFEDGALVGQARLFDLRTTVPGGMVPTAGLSAVGVLPTHSRRGHLRRLMDTVLVDERARGNVISSLRASQAAIYGRFGYGLAGLYADYELTPPVALRRSAGASRHRLRLLEGAEALPVLTELYEQVGRRRVGAIDRPMWWWTRNYEELTAAAGGTTRWVAVSVDGAGVTDGYVDVSLADPPLSDPTRHRLTVNHLFAGGDDAYRALWSHVLGIELVATVSARQRPIDEPLRWMLEDPRALRTTAVNDEQWIRLLDVGAALAARRFAPSAETVSVEVLDELFADNNGVYRLGGPGPRSAERIDRPGELAMDVAALGALYLGGVRAVDLVAAGRIEERVAGAAVRADALLGVGPAPWCGSFF